MSAIESAEASGSKMTLVYIVGHPRQIKPYAELFLKHKNKVFRGTRDINEADIVVFTGGADVHPFYYGEQPLNTTQWDDERDRMDLDAWNASEGKLRVGICRGAQFLNVMCGGTLWQHVDNHASIDHTIIDVVAGSRIYATSTHHQMMIPAKSGRLVAYAMEAKTKIAHGKEWEKQPGIGEVAFLDPNIRDPEVVMYDEQKCLCFQPHPELWNATEGLKTYFFNQLEILSLRQKAKEALDVAGQATTK